LRALNASQNSTPHLTLDTIVGLVATFTAKNVRPSK